MFFLCTPFRNVRQFCNVYYHLYTVYYNARKCDCDDLSVDFLYHLCLLVLVSFYLL